MHTERTIKKVARASHFTDPKVIMRRFRAIIELSPSEYRNSNYRIHLNNPHVDNQITLPKHISDKIGCIPEQPFRKMEHVLKHLIKPIGRRSPISWILQIVLLGVVCTVYEKMIPVDATALFGAETLLLAIYFNFALTKRFGTERD